MRIKTCITIEHVYCNLSTRQKMERNHYVAHLLVSLRTGTLVVDCDECAHARFGRQGPASDFAFDQEDDVSPQNRQDTGSK